VHSLVARVREAVGTPGPLEEAYLELLGQRLAGLEACLTGAPWREPRGARVLARRFLALRVGSWHDGDENLVREQLDGWTRGRTDWSHTARRLLAVADQLAAIEARPETVWFFLWELESLLRQNPAREG
jgi:hypothetical protein